MKKLNLFFAKFANKDIHETVSKGLDLLDDKTNDAGASYLKEKIRKANGMIFKQKLNLGGTGSIVTLALSLIYTKGLDWMSISLLVIGAAYSIIMTYLARLDKQAFNHLHYKHLAEKNENDGE